MSNRKPPRVIRRAAKRAAAQPRPDRSPTMHLSPTATMVMHSNYVDNLCRQAPHHTAALLQLGNGVSLEAFAHNVGTGFLRLVPCLDVEDQPAVACEVRTDDGYQRLYLVAADLLHVDADAVREAWSQRMDDGLRGITEEPEA